MIRTNAAVREVIVEGGSGAGVRLRRGETIRARAVAANVAPKLLVPRSRARQAQSSRRRVDAFHRHEAPAPARSA